jgi:signal transduction histidine kinase
MGKVKAWLNDKTHNALLNRVTNVLNASLDLIPLLDKICYETVQSFDIEAMAILLYDEISNTLQLSAGISQEEITQDKIPPIPYRAIVERLDNTGNRIVIQKQDEIIGQPYERFCRSCGMVSGVIIGITADNRILGALVAYTISVPRVFTKDEFLLLNILANLIAASLRKHRINQEYRRRTRELEMLTLVSSSLRQAEKSEDMLPILVNNAREVFSADLVTFYLEDTWSKPLPGVKPRRNIIHAHGNSHDVLFVPRNHTIWKIAESSQLPFYLTVAELENKFGRGILNQEMEGLHAFALSSVKMADGVIALLFLGFFSPHIFPDDERRLLQALSEMGGNALQRAGMMETLEQRVADRTHELGALYDIAKVASEYSDLKVILEKSLDNVLKIIGCEIGFIHLLDENGQDIDLTIRRSDPPDYLKEVSFSPLKMMLWKRVIEQNRPLLLTGPDLETGITETFPGKIPRIYLGVPIFAKGKTFGVLSIVGKDARQFNIEEIALLSAIADQMGVAVESAHLRKQAERAAVMEERQRLARELHDAVSQSLYSLTLLAEACRQTLQNGNMDNISEWINDISITSHDALKEMRLLLYELRPSTIERDGFVGAIKRRLESVESRAGVNTHLNVEGESPLPLPIAEQLYRIVQEALNNILKHASASDVTVNLKFIGCELELDIIDNGIGLNPEIDFSKGGLGLLTMKERAEDLGGVFSVHSTQGNGTMISVTMEIPNAKKD